jgi:hypothetical protein
MDFVALLQQYMDPYAVIIAIGFAALLIHFFPKLGESGTIWNRLMPLVPLVVAVATVLFKDYWIVSKTMTLGMAVVKGLCSGFAAVYFSRSFKVSFLGA